VNAARITDYITSNLIFALIVFLPSRLTSSERQLKQRSDDIWAIQSSLALKLKSASTISPTAAPDLVKSDFPHAVLLTLQQNRGNYIVRLLFNDVTLRQAETSIHFEQNGRFVTFAIVTLGNSHQHTK
jgi:hypothetical protein